MAEKKLIVVVLASLLCLIVPLARATKFHYCDTSAVYDVKVEGIEISPYPVERGKPVTFTINANTGAEISGGKMVMDVSILGFRIHSETHDLCEETNCPVPAGDFVISQSRVLPPFTLHGSLTLTMSLMDEESRVLTCIGFKFRLGVGSSVANS
ncbi:putative phosphatidylglycerol/phosphatidylinositol transfer protein DDB_G0282179 [Morus notabilis]|nr:putative phosphatidylglycerol/phosphatidylinositol transfer protein DDB_G0282179 [Morus notabilis]